MKYMFSYVTTEGAVRKVNQDSLFAAEAEFRGENIFFAAVCEMMASGYNPFIYFRF